MKGLLILVLAGTVFGVGRCSAPDPSTHYKVIHRTDTKTVHVPVAAPLPESCREAVTALHEYNEPAQATIDALAEVDRLTIQMSVFTGQDQIEVNKLKVEVQNLLRTVDRMTADITVAKNDADRQIVRCDRDLQKGVDSD